MRTVREITSEEENFRLEPLVGTRIAMIKRDPVEPEPVGTIVLMAFRVTGYDKDCDGSLMARLEHIDGELEPTGWEPHSIGLYPGTDLVVTEDEWKAMFIAPAATVTGWRLLEVGEVIQAGDEYFSRSLQEWRDVGNFAGDNVEQDDMPYRRRLTGGGE